MSDKDDLEILLDLRDALMADNRRLERELKTVREQAEMMHNAWLEDEHIQADGSIRPSVSDTITRLTAERDEARAWARHYYWWSGFLSELVSVWSKKWYADFRKKGGTI